MKKAEKVKLQPAVIWEGNSFVRAASLGPAGEICVLWTTGESELFSDGVPGAMMEQPMDYEAVVVKDGQYIRMPLKNQKWSYHFIEYLNEYELLMASARSVFHADGREERNGRVFDPNGKIIRSFCLGDGINHLSATGDGRIWSGYFDEGVYGNNHWEQPIGEKGLIGWDTEGNMVEWHGQPQDHFISDCYALNVVADGEVWFYFYDNFHIGIRKNGETAYRVSDIEGATVFAVHKDWILFSGGYADRGRYFLCKRNGDRYRTQQELMLLNAKGKKIDILLTYARGSKLLLQTETESYIFDLAEWIQQERE